jgi:signal transduction histidine kinase
MKKLILLFLLSACLQSHAQKVDIAYVDSLIYFTQYLGADESKADSLILMANIIEENGFKIGYKLGAIYGFRFKGWAYDYKGDYDKAISYFLKFLKVANHEGFEAEKIMAYGDLGGLYTFTGRHQEAKEMYELATKNEKFRTEQPKRLSTFYNNLGFTYTNLGKRDSALIMYYKSLELKVQTKDSLGMLNLKTNLSSFLIEENRLEDAEKMILENIELCKAIVKKGDLWHNYINYGALKSKQKQFPKAEMHYQNALSIANELDSDPFRKESYAALALINEKQGNFKKAYEMEQLFKSVSEKITNKETNDKISELRESYEAEERENENRLLNVELDAKKTLQRYLLGGLILFAILSALIALALRKNRLKNKLLKKQNDLINQQKNKLTSLNEDKNELISIVSHDLRSPFNTIILWIDTLKSKLPNELEAIGMIKKTALYGQQMVNNILDIEKMEINTHTVSLKNTDLVELSQELIHDFKPAADGKNIKLHLIEGKELHPIMTDAVLLRRAMENLISNALKYSPPESEVWVNIHQNKTETSITVKDNGQGIAQDEHAKLFTKYGQTASTTTEKSTGLGLSIVKRIADELGAKLSFKSELGLGSEFTITFLGG